MSKRTFHGTITVNSITPLGSGNYQFEALFLDMAGLFRPHHIVINDLIFINTNEFEPGTLTRYKVLEIISVHWSGNTTLKVKYDSTNDNLSPEPPINWLSSVSGFITRPTPNLKIVSLPTPSEQNIDERYAFQVQNYNAFQILDNIESGGIASFEELGIGLKTVKVTLHVNGIALLPSKPYGDILHNLAIVHLHDESVMEVLGLTIAENNGQYYVVMNQDDYNQIKEMAHSITVTYLSTL